MSPGRCGGIYPRSKMTALRPECRAVFGFIKIPKISLWLREFMRGEVPSLQDHPVSKRRGWSSKGTQPFEPEESKETALGFRGTRLWLQSLVCYTFAKERVARSHPLDPALAVKLAEQRLADGANCTRLPAFLPSAEQRYTKPRRSGRPISLSVFLSGWPHL